MTKRLSPWIAGAALVGLTVTIFKFVHVGAEQGAGWQLLWWTLTAWVLFAVGATAVLSSPRKAAIWLILAGGIALQVVAMSAPPRTSDDALRYAWDGRVQAAGINPYEFKPVDPQLAPLRDEWLFPPGRVCPDKGVPADCPIINRPTVNTIYPPFAQLSFLAVDVVSPVGSQSLPWQLVSAVIAVAVTVLLLIIARARGSDERWAVLWAWCPLVAIELANNSHIDGLSTLLVVAGIGLVSAGVLSRKSAIGAGVLIGLAIATKLTPAVVLPGVIRRRPISILLATAATVVTVYLPYVLGAGSGVLGFLTGYVEEETGGQFALIKLFMPTDFSSADRVAAVIGLTMMSLVGLWALLRSDPLRPWHAAAALVGASLLITTPNYPWYALLLVALVAMGARASWLCLPLAMSVLYLIPTLDTQYPYSREFLFGICAVIVLIDAGTAWWRTSRRPASLVTLSP